MFECRGSRFVAAGLAATRVQCREGGYGMGAHRFTKRLATGLVLALSSVFAAQTVGAVSEKKKRPSWSDSAMAEGWRAVCGDVRNVGQVPARSVAIRVQGLGSTGQVVSTRDHYVLADVPAGSRSVFCVRRGDFVQRDGPPRRLGIRGGAVGNPALDAGGAPWTTVSDARG